MEGIEIMDKLEITLKITDKEGIIIGRSVILFGKPRYVAGLWNNNSVVFSILEPKTMSETQVLIYTIDELREFAKEGDLKGMVEL
jgi:hypothetical protein